MSLLRLFAMAVRAFDVRVGFGVVLREHLRSDRQDLANHVVHLVLVAHLSPGPRGRRKTQEVPGAMVVGRAIGRWVVPVGEEWVVKPVDRVSGWRFSDRGLRAATASRKQKKECPHVPHTRQC